MQEWLILQMPELLLLYGGSFLCILLDVKWQASRGVLTWIGGVLGVIAAAVLLLMGGSLWEAAAWMTALIILLIGGEQV